MNESAKEVDLREDLADLLDEFGVPEFTWATVEGEPVTKAEHHPMKRLRNMLQATTSPANKTAFVCSQLFNALKHFRDGDYVKCECTDEQQKAGDHEITCPSWTINFLIAGFENQHMPTDAEIWMRALSLVHAMQMGRRRGTMIGLTQVPEIALDELVHLGNGHPAAVTDAYAQMESLRTVLKKMEEHANQPTGAGTKVDRSRRRGGRAALRHWIPHLQEIVDAQATDICVGLIQSFAAWLTTRKEAITVGRTEVAGPMAVAVEEFISQSHLRRRPEQATVIDPRERP